MAYHHPTRRLGLITLGLLMSIASLVTFFAIYFMANRPSDALFVSSFVGIFIGLVVFAVGEWTD